MANDVKIEIDLETRKAIKALAQLNKGLGKVGDEGSKKIKKADTALDTLKKRFSALNDTSSVFFGNIAADLAMSSLGALTNQLGKTFDEMVQFEKGLLEIQTITGLTSDEVDGLTKDLTEQSKKFATLPERQAKAFYQIISSGAAEGAEAVELLDSANTLALGGLADLGGSINVITDILNVYGKENITAEEAADTLFTTVRLGKTTVEELASSIGLVLPSAQRLGVSLEEVGASLATMTGQGLTTAQRVTQLNALFTALFKKSADAEKNFGKKIGDAFSLAALRTKGLSQFLIDLQDATGGNEEVLSKLLGRTEAVQAVFSLTGDAAKTFEGNLEGMTEKAGAASDAADQMRESLDFKLEEAQRSISSFTTSLIDDLTPALKAALDLTTAFFSGPQLEEQALEDKIQGITNNINRMAKEINNIDENGGLLDSLLGRKDDLLDRIGELKELRSELEKQRDVQQKIKAESQENVEPQGQEGGGEKSRAEKAIEAEKKLQGELRMLKEEQRMLEEEDRILEQEKTFERRQRELQATLEHESKKAQIKLQSKLEENESIKDAKQKELANQKAFAEAEKSVLKAQNKLKKKTLEDEEKIEKNNLEARKRFMDAGFTLLTAGLGQSKALQSAQAVVNTYTAANQALATPPGPPTTYPLVAATIAQGLANVVKINSQSFQGGGVVGGFQGATGGADTTTANVRTGEMVLNASQQRNLFDNINQGGGDNSEMIAAINRLANRPVSVQIEGKEVARSVRDAREEGFAI